jgi:hypothetical protein
LRLYLAGRFEDQGPLRVIRDRLQSMGHIVTSNWLDVTPEVPEGWSESSYYWENALLDLMDLKEADVIVLWTANGIKGGAATEYGYVLGRNSCVSPPTALYIVGPKTSVFHELCDRWFPDWEDLFNHLSNPVPARQEAK